MRSCLLLILILVSSSLSAPVPPHRPKGRPTLVGKAWTLQWGHAMFHKTVFAKDGFYESGDHPNARWEGRWKFEECIEGDVLIVTEDDRKYIDEFPYVITVSRTWKVKLSSERNWKGIAKYEGGISDTTFDLIEPKK